MKYCFALTLLIFSVSARAADTIPLPFMPQIFGQFPNVRDFALSNNGDEIYFTVESYKKEFSAILFIKRIKDTWSAPEVATFSGQYRDLEPFFSSDGLTMYFVSTRPVNASTTKDDADIWYVKRATLQAAWSAPVNLGSPVNTLKDEYYPSLAKNGNIYFTRESADENRKEDIFRSVYSNGKYAEPVALSDSVNSTTYEFNAFVTPDEQYLLFSSYGRPDDMGGSDLYISHKNKSGEWSAARNLGPAINSKRIDFCPFYDARDHILYFTSERNTLPLQYPAPQNWEQLKKEMNRYSNGQSRLYIVPLFDAYNVFNEN